MNYYERIQQSLDYIEDHLSDAIPLEEAAARACFSISHYYRMFHALVGHTVKDYIRRRRLSEAARRLVSGEDRIIDICFDYQFESQESFTRAFKRMFGITPGRFRSVGNQVTGLEPVDLIARYFEPDENKTAADPGIKVLKELYPMRVASYRAVSESPERNASKHILTWADNMGLLASSGPYRIFGFDNPAPVPGNPIYGYEVWLTVGPNVEESGGIKIRDFEGGKYAVTGTTVAGIKEAWKHFQTWLRVSKYSEGHHQCLEELLSPIETKEESMQIDLYLPLATTLTQDKGPSP